MKNSKQNNTDLPVQKRFFRNFVVVLSLIVTFFLVGRLWDAYAANTIAQNTGSLNSKKASNGIYFAKIQDVQVGDRTIGKNPKISEEDREVFLSEPTPDSWRKLTLEMVKSNGKLLDIIILRPLSWIEEVGAVPGNTIHLELNELGTNGSAKVLSIEPCPTIKPGKGNVVTGTFHHEAENIIDVYVKGVEKPIGCTENHLFWSETRQEFVEAIKLQQNEKLKLHDGKTSELVQIEIRPGSSRVHNLEVLNEHVYFIADIGILVHNECTGDRPSSKHHDHHIVMKGDFNHWGILGRSFVKVAQDVLRRYGIDVLDSPKNRVWAINSGHSKEYAFKIALRMLAAEGVNGRLKVQRSEG